MKKNNTLNSLLNSKYNSNLVDKIISSYLEIEENYRLEKWKYQGLDAGHFVECIRRLLEFELFGTSIDFSKKINNFSYSELQKYENSKGNDSYRFFIPQALKTIYSIRNKRGIGHIKEISANKIDATLILFSCKWILAELVRLNSNLNIVSSQELIDDIIDKKLDIIWLNGEKIRILDTKIKTEEQVLILLYTKDKQSIKNLIDVIEYKNSSRFKIILGKMHKERLLELDLKEGICDISPKGILKAEEIIKKYS